MSFHELLTRLFELEEINGGKRCPTYLYRWELLRAFGWAVYLHKFVGDDWSTDLHDHPKRFISIGLRGRYVEHYPCRYQTWTAHSVNCGFGRPALVPPPRPGQPALVHNHELRAPWVRSFPADHVHRLTGPTPERPCWTVVIVGRPVREWGFWVDGAWTWWRDYLKSPEADQHKACR